MTSRSKYVRYFTLSGRTTTENGMHIYSPGVYLSLLALLTAVEVYADGIAQAALRYAERNRSQAAESVAQARRQVELSDAELRIAFDIERDALRLDDRTALTVAREAIAEGKLGLQESNRLLARAQSLLAQRERTLQDLHAELRTGTARNGIVVVDGGDVRRYSADGVAVDDATGTLRSGETIRTGADGSARLFLGERGSQVQLAPESEFSVSEASSLGDVIGELRQGLVRLLARLDRGERFEVRTPAAVCAVRGTDFAVENRGGCTQVRVFSGVVEVTPTGQDQAIEVNAGQQWSTGAQAPESFDVNVFPAPWENGDDAP